MSSHTDSDRRRRQRGSARLRPLLLLLACTLAVAIALPAARADAVVAPVFKRDSLAQSDSLPVPTAPRGVTVTAAADADAAPRVTRLPGVVSSVSTNQGVKIKSAAGSAKPVAKVVAPPAAAVVPPRPVIRSGRKQKGEEAAPPAAAAAAGAPTASGSAAKRTVPPASAPLPQPNLQTAIAKGKVVPTERTAKASAPLTLTTVKQQDDAPAAPAAAPAAAAKTVAAAPEPALEPVLTSRPIIPKSEPSVLAPPAAVTVVEQQPEESLTEPLGPPLGPSPKPADSRPADKSAPLPLADLPIVSSTPAAVSDPAAAMPEPPPMADLPPISDDDRVISTPVAAVVNPPAAPVSEPVVPTPTLAQPDTVAASTVSPDAAASVAATSVKTVGSASPRVPPDAKINKKPRAVIKDGKITPPLPGSKPTPVGSITNSGDAAAALVSTATGAHADALMGANGTSINIAEAEEAVRVALATRMRDIVMTGRQKLKERAAQSAALHSVPKAPRNATAVTSEQLSTLPSTARHATGLNMRRAESDPDVLHTMVHPQAAAEMKGTWSPLHGVLLFLIVFTAVCVRRFMSRYRGGQVDAGGVISRTQRLLSALVGSWDKKYGPGMDSPVHVDARTRELASLSFVDGQSRMRRGVKAGMGTSGGSVSSGSSGGRHLHEDMSPLTGDIELQSMTSSLASLHIPKMIHLSSSGEEQSHDADLPTPSQSVLTPQLLQLLLPYLPSSSHIQDLACKYKLSVCGASIADLYRRCGKTQDTLTVIQDSAGYIFGCYVSSAWRVHDSYFGLGTCFVFTLHPSFKVFPASGSNQFFQLANNSAMALGGGDNFAIWIDEALRKGTSKHCDTFASPSLSSEEEFRCNDLEVWSFVDGQW